VFQQRERVMSEQNGTVASEPTNGEVVNRLPKPKKGKRGKVQATGGILGFYTRCGTKPGKKSITLRAVEGDDTATLTVNSFPGLTREDITAAAASVGCSTSFKLTVEGVPLQGKGAYAGEAAESVAEDFFNVNNVDDETEA
jgi:hypothetical protein